jgi:hypothetical protein
MKRPICDFISSDLETHSKFHVEMDFLADNETIPPKKKDDSRREVPITIMLCLWYHGKDNLPLQRSYVL